MAVIDVGSNSVRMVMHEVRGRAMTPSFNEKILAGLGRGLPDTGRLNPEGVALALSALGRFAAINRAQKCDEVIAFATAAVREAEDGREFVELVRRRTGLELRILSGDEEARCAAQGVLAGSPDVDGVVGDLGGSSMELARVVGGKFVSGATFPLGPLRNGADGGFSEDKVLDRARAALAGADELAHGHSVFFAVGGAWRAIAAIHMQVAKAPLHMLQNYEMSASDLVSLLKELAGGKKHASLVNQLAKRRAPTIPYASTVLRAVLEEGKFQTVMVSSFGVREGMVFETLSDAERLEDPLEAGLAAYVEPDSPSCQFGRALGDWIDPAADHLLPARLARAACRLVDIGALLHPDHRADLAFELVARAPLPGLTHKDRAALALAVAARYKRGVRSAVSDALLDADVAKRARSLGALMRLGAEFSGRSASLLRHASLHCDGQTIEFRVAPRQSVLVSESVERRLQQASEELGMSHILTT
ncbi:MAG: Ppx/GppA family phosphatase [Hyphomonadaceae bacterium]